MGPMHNSMRPEASGILADRSRRAVSACIDRTDGNMLHVILSDIMERSLCVLFSILNHSKKKTALSISVVAI